MVTSTGLSENQKTLGSEETTMKDSTNPLLGQMEIKGLIHKEEIQMAGLMVLSMEGQMLGLEIRG